MSKPSATFRFLDLNKMQAFTLQKEVEGAYYTASARDGRFVGSVELCEHRFDELNIFFVRQQIDITQCDIHIVAKLEQPSQQVAVPLAVNKLLKHIDCQLTFSVIKSS
ncbi:hypothetical protein [Paraglaciecola agarilytica]|uniref:hypothetical protein n=1 Tax=Paraglaciecola chathamensis TaxID=368405 RepID=UPI0023520A78|nr:hypothetical protein [Paraglaciecola agarilytica]|tara:strand:- start:32943 stop:33266 length:324 start_codon:yes stop_codon:yes gene_type:complete